MKRLTNRRQFIRETGLAGFGFWVAGGLTAGESTAPSERLNIGCIGVGGMGARDSFHAGKVGNVVALCDIDDEQLNTDEGHLRVFWRRWGEIMEGRS